MIRKPRTFPPATDSGPFAAFGSRSGGGCRSLGDCRMAGGGCDSGSGGHVCGGGSGDGRIFSEHLREGYSQTAGHPYRRKSSGRSRGGGNGRAGCRIAGGFGGTVFCTGPAGFSGAASGRNGLGEAGQTDAAGAMGRLRMPGRPQHVSGEQGGPPCRLLRIRERPDGRERGGDFGKIKEKIFFSCEKIWIWKNSCYLCTRNASLAQLVEHDTLNVGVQGSSP